MILAICCLLMSNFSYVMVTESDDASTDITDEQNGEIYDGGEEMLRQSLSGERISLGGIVCRYVKKSSVFYFHQLWLWVQLLQQVLQKVILIRQ